ncbi:MAG: acyl-CoA/acyl-ACP dehydrogenase [Microbacteriaceae bacterium]|nr:acyl-CoA/acyl-ACP dehydrogenase [Microbacteriaceae bacterium]
MATTDPRELLDDDLLAVFRDRAAKLDAANEFPVDDLDDLRELGYLTLLAPRELGGGGLTLEQVARLQMRLATAAPATALAVNMHLITTGVVRVLRERGDESIDWIAREAVAGEVIALAISETGNDAVTFDSTVTAVPDGEGGYTFTGTKIFTTLSPVWTRLWIFGRDDSGDEPRLVHAMLHRTDEGIRIHDDWDTVGMRPTQSCTTSLEGVHVAADRVIGYSPVGPNGAPLVFGIFANFLLLIGACYIGIGDRAVELAVEAAHGRTSRVAGGAPYADDPAIRDIVARMGMRQLAARTFVESVARDVDEVADHGTGWFPRFTVAKHDGTRAARETVADALEVVGGSAFRSQSELGRLYRDVAASVFHPSQDRVVRSGVAGWLLGPTTAQKEATGTDD